MFFNLNLSESKFKKNPRFLFSFDQHFYSSLHEILFFAGIKYFILLKVDEWK